MMDLDIGSMSSTHSVNVLCWDIRMSTIEDGLDKEQLGDLFHEKLNLLK